MPEKAKEKIALQIQDKNRRKNKFFAHAGLDNHDWVIQS